MRGSLGGTNMIDSFRRHGTWWTILAVAGVLVAGVQRGNDAAAMMGAYVGLFFLSRILAGIPWVVALAMRRRLSSLQYMYTFTVSFAIISLLTLVGFLAG